MQPYNIEHVGTISLLQIAVILTYLSANIVDVKMIWVVETVKILLVPGVSHRYNHSLRSTYKSIHRMQSSGWRQHDD